MLRSTVRGVVFDPVGIKEIAERLGVPPGTVAVWHHRGLMPKSRHVASGKPVWRWATIRKWAEQTGRLPKESE